MRKLVVAAMLVGWSGAISAYEYSIGSERSDYERLEDGEEYQLSQSALILRGQLAFEALWTVQEGGGRPLTNGVGGALTPGAGGLEFPRNFNRVSAQDANGCAGCHNAPFGRSGGGGDFVTGVFVGAQRFDFASFDLDDLTPRSGSVDERGEWVTLSTIGNYRATPGMYGAGFIEMLARQMTAELQQTRDRLMPGESGVLETKGVNFGVLSRDHDGAWNVSQVEGLPPQSLRIAESGMPSLVIHPFHQSGSVVSIRQFTNNAFNHHHGMQSTERFGDGVDADGDGVVDELTRADITAVSLFQATLPAPSIVLPRDRAARQAAARGARTFKQIGCADCHIPALPLVDEGWIYTEPNPYNPPGNLQPSDAPSIAVDLSKIGPPAQRLKPRNGVLWVPAFTDLKLHDITDGPDDPGRESININHPGGSDAFFAGNSEFLTKKLWGAANERPYFHHGKFTTMREATLAHAGEAANARAAFEGLSEAGQNELIEFLKTLQVPPPR